MRQRRLSSVSSDVRDAHAHAVPPRVPLHAVPSGASPSPDEDENSGRSSTPASAPATRHHALGGRGSAAGPTAAHRGVPLFRQTAPPALPRDAGTRPARVPYVPVCVAVVCAIGFATIALSLASLYAAVPAGLVDRPVGLAAAARAATAPGLRGVSATSPGAVSDAAGDAVRRLLAHPRYASRVADAVVKLLEDPATTAAEPRALAATLAAALASTLSRVDARDDDGGGGGVDGANDGAARLAALWSQRGGGAASRDAPDGTAGAAEVPPTAAPAPSASAAPAPSPPLLPPHHAVLPDGRTFDARYTQQTCYLAGDESETCAFDGVLCFDGAHPVAVVDNPEPGEVADPTSDCMDYRYSEPTSWSYSSCRYDAAGDRRYDPSSPPRPATDHPIDLRDRYLGPANRREVLLREVGPESVFPGVGGADGWGAAAAAGAEGATGGGSAPRADASDGAFDHPDVPGLRVARRVTAADGGVVDFVDGALWLLPLNGQSFANPYMFFASAAALFAAQRANGTSAAGRGAWGDHPADGFVGKPARGALYRGQQASIGMHRRTHNTARYVAGAQWDLPPQDTVVFLGSGGSEIARRAALGSWFEGVLGLSAAPAAAVFFNDLRAAYAPGNMSAGAGGAGRRLLCARRGAMTSQKPRMFTTAADAWMFRHYAYRATGLTARGVASHAAHPPRQITVLDRKGLHGRGIFNHDEFTAALHATGLHVEFVSRMDHLSFAEQVAIMSRTGILVACHGGALMNAMFLPQHAVVIELFPPLMKLGVYRALAAVMGLTYMPIYTKLALPSSMSTLTGPRVKATPEFEAACVAVNVSSVDATLLRYCNWFSKTHPIVVPVRVLRRALDDAMDATSAFSLTNPEWAAEARAAGLPRPTALAMLADDADVDTTTPAFRAVWDAAVAAGAKASPKPFR